MNAFTNGVGILAGMWVNSFWPLLYNKYSTLYSRQPNIYLTYASIAFFGIFVLIAMVNNNVNTWSGSNNPQFRYTLKAEWYRLTESFGLTTASWYLAKEWSLVVMNDYSSSLAATRVVGKERRVEGTASSLIPPLLSLSELLLMNLNLPINGIFCFTSFALIMSFKNLCNYTLLPLNSFYM